MEERSIFGFKPCHNCRCIINLIRKKICRPDFRTNQYRELYYKSFIQSLLPYTNMAIDEDEKEIPQEEELVEETEAVDEEEKDDIEQEENKLVNSIR